MSPYPNSIIANNHEKNNEKTIILLGRTNVVLIDFVLQINWFFDII